MKEIKVIYYVDDKEMLDGEKPRSEIYDSLFIEAESEELAIELAKDCLIEDVRQNSDEYNAELNSDGDIDVIDSDGIIIERYYGFKVEADE